MHLCMVFAQLCATPAKSQPPPHPDPPHPPIMTLKTFCPSLTPIALGITLRPCLWSSKPRWKLRQELWAVSQSPDQEWRLHWGGDDLAMAVIRNLKWILICLSQSTVTPHLGTIWIAAMNTFLGLSLYLLEPFVNYCLHSILIWELIQRKVSSYNPQVKTRIYKAVSQLHMVTVLSDRHRGRAQKFFLSL